MERFFKIVVVLFFVLSQPTSNAAQSRQQDALISPAIVPHVHKNVKFHSFPENFEYTIIRDMYQDHVGFMWFGTAEGLIRFDGLNLYEYNSSSGSRRSISNNIISSIVEDRYNNLWVGTFNGLNLYNRSLDRFERINISGVEPEPTIIINSLSVFNDSLMFVVSHSGNITVVDIDASTSQTEYKLNASYQNLLNESINEIKSYKEELLCIGTENGIFLYFIYIDNQGVVQLEPTSECLLDNNAITSLAIDPDGEIWAGSRGNGLFRLIPKGSQWEIMHYKTNAKGKQKISNNNILSVHVDVDGAIWAGTENGGVNLIDKETGQISVFVNQEGNNFSISSNSVWSIYSDRSERIWLGTFNRGVNVVDPGREKFQSFSKDIFSFNSPPINEVKGFAEDKNGNIWIASDGYGIAKYNTESGVFTKHIQNKGGVEKLINNFTQCIMYSSDNHIWVGTWDGGIDKLSLNGERIATYKPGKDTKRSRSDVITLYEDPWNNIWAGTAGCGLYKYCEQSDNFIHIISTNESPVFSEGSHITSIFCDSDSTVWVATLYGMSILQHSNDTFSVIDNLLRYNTEGLSSYMIEFLFVDSKERIWAGSFDGGLNLFNKSNRSFTSIQEKDGLPSNTIKGMVEDNNGVFWVSTNKGLCRFNYDEFSFQNFTVADGLNSNSFHTNSNFKTSSGMVLFGNKYGFNAFYPEDIGINEETPTVVLKSISVNNKELTPSVPNSPIEKHISQCEEIILKHNQSSFSIDFVALNFTNPSKNQFCYMLEGFDKDWNYIGSTTTAKYTNIKPGTYTFKVKGSNNDNVWNKKPHSLSIIIKPPYWKTWWAYTLYVIIFIVTTLAALKAYYGRMKIKNQLQIEKIARIKEQELNKSNISFFTNISHEFRTPLSLIIAPLEGLLDESDSKFRKHLLTIQQNAERLMQLTNNLLDIRRMEAGVVALEVQYSSLNNFVDKVVMLFTAKAEQSGIKFTFKSNPQHIEGWFDSEKLETILVNLLSNAFKFTPDNGSIEIFAEKITENEIINKQNGKQLKTDKQNTYLKISVVDSGKGIPDNELSDIFEKFYQVKSGKKNRERGTGIGLTYSKGLVELHRGNIWVDSTGKNGSCFSFIIPINREAYSDNEIAEFPKNQYESSDLLSSVSNQTAISSTKNQQDVIEKASVLIVEDNKELRSFLVHEIGKTYEVFEASNGNEGFKIATEKMPELIVSDLMMPQCDGIEMFRMLKNEINTSHIPLILLTAKNTMNDQIDGIEAGVDAYITKPFSVKFLKVKIKQLIHSRRELYAHFSQNAYFMPNKIAQNKIDQDFMQKAIDYIVDNMADNMLNVENMAEHLNMSRSNLYRKIKALTGKSIVDYIKLIRLKQAVHLIRKNNCSLTEVAYQTGFSSLSYFSKSFKEQFGKTPSEFLAN